jgi:hypothetical protein
MRGSGRQVSGRAASGRLCVRGSPLPGHFGRTKPTADFGRTKPTLDSLGPMTACAPAALDQGSRAGQSARRCPASLGQHKSFRGKALGRVVPLSRGCGIGTLRQFSFRIALTPRLGPPDPARPDHEHQDRAIR